jgi:hypothetical protein
MEERAAGAALFASPVLKILRDREAVLGSLAWFLTSAGEDPERETSGRIEVKQDKNGVRAIVAVEPGGIADILRGIPAIITDATLPSVEVLRVFFPQVRVEKAIAVRHGAGVHVMQVLKSPVSRAKTKLITHGGEAGEADRDRYTKRKGMARPVDLVQRHALQWNVSHLRRAMHCTALG